MPELPEVETVVRDLRPCLVGRRLTAVKQTSRHALRTPWRSAWNDETAGRKVHAVSRRGKWILLELDGEKTLVVHLGMTGQLTIGPAAAAVADHTHLIFVLNGGEKELRFRDIRRFGSVRLFSTPRSLTDFFTAAKLGPEPFEVPKEYWRDCLRATRRIVKAVLLDQSVVAGVGNIYADESLFQARLHPGQPAHDLDNAEAERLRRAVATVITRAIEWRGSSIRDYVGGSGLKGEYQNEFRVYGRTGAPCPRCGEAIACLRLAGRSSHFCPTCQKFQTTKHTKNTKKRVTKYALKKKQKTHRN